MSNFSDIERITSLHKNNELQLLCFRLEDNNSLFALNVFKVKEVIKYKGEIVKLDHDNTALIEGLITMRNLTIPLIDLRKWFHYNPGDTTQDLSPYAIESKQKVVLICDFSKFIVGIRVYKPDRILPKRWDEIDQSVSVGVNSDSSKLISRTKYYDGRIVQVVDVEKMLADAFPWIEETKNTEIERLTSLSDIKKEVLVADDSTIVIKTLNKILNKLELNFKIFKNGRELLDYIDSDACDKDNIGIVITDLEMPVASGFEVIKSLKSDKTLCHVPIVVNSSMSGKSNEEMAKSLNANEFMSKSNPEELSSILKKYLL
ncbi:MAG: chemotaxis protein CheW [Campylobacterales bacterium]